MPLNRRVFLALMLFFGIVGMGTVGYKNFEGHSWLESFYMSAITITTVGYGDFTPHTELGRIFTIGLIIIGFVCIAFTGHAVAESLLKDVWGEQAEKKKMNRKIAKLKDHYILCGFGRVGAPAAQLFQRENADFVVIESQPEQVEAIKEMGMLHIDGDATREAVLNEANIKAARGLLALLGSDPDNLFVVLTARECNPTLHIISRSEDGSSESRMFRAGADMVISPFKAAGKEVASSCLAATGKITQDAAFTAMIPLNQTPQWFEVNEGSSMVGQTVESVSQHMGREVLGLRRNDKDFIAPDPDLVIESWDMLFVLDDEPIPEEVEAPKRPAEPEKLVIVDDNPVIVRLYTRLFQKAGFHILTAENGKDGLDLILNEKPAAAVIDFLLPGLSGINVCAEVRNADPDQTTKLILFTADDQAETYSAAMEAGADAVVVKSPEAAEVIETVLRILSENQPVSSEC